jgi:TolB protein
LAKGLQFNSTKQGWRRIAHKVADEVYSRITGEQGYFDSRVVYVAETGKKALVKNVWLLWTLMERIQNI